MQGSEPVLVVAVVYVGTEFEEISDAGRVASGSSLQQLSVSLTFLERLV